MDMNMKSRLDLKNKKTKMAASLLQKFVLILAFFVMMAATANAGAFLNSDGTAIPTTELSISNLDTIENNSKDAIDEWENWDGGYTNPGVYSNKEDSPIEYSGFYLGTFGGNDGLTGGNVNLEELIQSFLGQDYFIEAYGKYDYDTDTYEDQIGLGLDSLHFTLFDTYENDGEIVGGSWKITDENETYLPNEKINFYSIKSSQKFALYYVDPAASTGTWTTAHVLDDNSVTVSDLKEISHFTVMRTNDITGGTSAVPEPATMLLFGFSLMGLAGMARRRNSKF